jgi:hypothetical protein
MATDLQWSQLGTDMFVVADRAGNSATVMRQQPFLGQKPPAPKYVVTASGRDPLEFYVQSDANAAAEALVRGEPPPTNSGNHTQWSRLGAEASVVVTSDGRWAVVMRQGPFLGQDPPVPKYVLTVDGEEPKEFFIEADAQNAAEMFVQREEA